MATATHRVSLRKFIEIGAASYGAAVTHPGDVPMGFLLAFVALAVLFYGSFKLTRLVNRLQMKWKLKGLDEIVFRELGVRPSISVIAIPGGTAPSLRRLLGQHVLSEIGDLVPTASGWQPAASIGCQTAAELGFGGNDPQGYFYIAAADNRLYVFEYLVGWFSTRLGKQLMVVPKDSIRAIATARSNHSRIYWSLTIEFRDNSTLHFDLNPIYRPELLALQAQLSGSPESSSACAQVHWPAGARPT
jgi:hypothetical protein